MLSKKSHVVSSEGVKQLLPLRPVLAATCPLLVWLRAAKTLANEVHSLVRSATGFDNHSLYFQQLNPV